MKNYKVIGLPTSGQPVYTPVFGSLQQVTIFRIVVDHSGVEAHFSTPNGKFSKVTISPDEPSRAFYPSYDAYINDAPITESHDVSTLLKILTKFKGVWVVENDGNIHVSGWLVEGNVVRPYKERFGATVFDLQNGEYVCQSEPFALKFYKSKEDALWEHDIHEILADGSVVIHEAEGEKWQLNERQAEIWGGIKGLLAEAEKENLHIFFEHDDCQLACFSYTDFTEIQGTESFDRDRLIDDGWTPVPRKAIKGISIPDFNDEWRPYLK